MKKDKRLFDEVKSNFKKEFEKSIIKKLYDKINGSSNPKKEDNCNNQESTERASKESNIADVVSSFSEKIESRIDPYMAFVVSYLGKRNKKQYKDLPLEMQRWEFISETLEEDKDKEILDYCFDYNNKRVKTYEFRNYILDKNLVEFCMKQFEKNISEKSSIRIPQCTIPTLALYNYNHYSYCIEYAEFESKIRYRALGKILTDSMHIRMVDGNNDFRGSLLVSPRIYFQNEKDEIIKCLKTDTQLIKEELKKLGKNGSLFVILSDSWLTNNEDEKWELIKEGKLVTVLKLPSYELHSGKKLIWLHFTKEKRHNEDLIDTIDETSNFENISSEELLRLKEQHIKPISIGDFIKRNTIENLYREYIDIIEKRFPEDRIKIKELIIENILVPLHSNLNVEFKEDAENEIRKYLLETFLSSCMKNNLIDEGDNSFAKIIALTNKLENIFLEQEEGGGKQDAKYITNMLHNLNCFGNSGSHLNNESPIKDCGYRNNILSCCFNYFCIIRWYDKFLTKREEQSQGAEPQNEPQKDIPQEVKNSDESKKDQTYKILKEGYYKYCMYGNEKALIQKGASVEEGDTVLLNKPPKENDDETLKGRYPLFIFARSCEVVSKN